MRPFVSLAVCISLALVFATPSRVDAQPRITTVSVKRVELVPGGASATVILEGTGLDEVVGAAVQERGRTLSSVRATMDRAVVSGKTRSVVIIAKAGAAATARAELVLATRRGTVATPVSIVVASAVPSVTGWSCGYDGPDRVAGCPEPWDLQASLYRERVVYITVEGENLDRLIGARVVSNGSVASSISPRLQPATGPRSRRLELDVPQAGQASPVNRLMDLELLSPGGVVVAPFRVRVPQPDLRIANVRLEMNGSDTPAATQPNVDSQMTQVALWWDVDNLGMGDIRFLDGAVRSRVEIPDLGIVKESTHSMSSASFALDDLPGSGRYRFNITLDPDNRVPEFSEHNNSLSWAGNIDPMYYPDLVIDRVVTVPAEPTWSPTSPASYKLMVHVKNLGPGFQRLGIAVNNTITANAGRLQISSPGCGMAPQWIAADMPAGVVETVELEPLPHQRQAGSYTCTFQVERIGPERDLGNNQVSHSRMVRPGQ